MQEEDNIKWENLIFYGMEQRSAPAKDRDYTNLYMELIDKCSPKHYLDTTKFDSAKNIYAELKKVKREYELADEIPEKPLIPIRDRAIHELGIQIQTKHKVDHLMQYFDPEIYIDMDPYPMERIRQANIFRKKVLQHSDDLLAIEAIEKEASEFISSRDEEILKQEKNEQQRRNREEKEKREQYEKEKRNDLVVACVIIGLSLIFFIIMVFAPFAI